MLVAASVGPVEDCYTPALVPDESELQREHGQMADWLAAAGPDLLWIETIGTVREVRAAAASAAERGLPFVVSFVLREMKDAVPAGGRNARSTDMPTLLGGELLEEAVAAVTPFGPLAIGLNCIPPRGLREALPRLRAMTDLPLAAYAHINNVSPTPGWSYSEAVGPAEYAAYAAGCAPPGQRSSAAAAGRRRRTLRRCAALHARLNEQVFRARAAARSISTANDRPVAGCPLASARALNGQGSEWPESVRNSARD